MIATANKHSAAAGKVHIKPLGPFSWDLAVTFALGLPGLRHQVASTEDGLSLSFLSDRTFTPVAVRLELRDAEVVGEIVESEVGQSDHASVTRQVARILSLDHDATTYPEVGRRDPAVAELMETLPGLRPVNFSSPYDCAIWAVLSQRINTTQAASIKKRLIAAHGTTFDVGVVEVGCIPTPKKMLAVKSFPGLPAVKLERLHAVAKAALDGLLDADYLLSLGDKAPDAVRVIPGIGPFWSQGIYMRTCGVTDVWPVEPLSNAALGVLHGLGDEPSAADIERLTELYRPWRTWVAVLLRFAAGRGYIPNFAGREGRIRRGARSRS
jgi:DNA-3-methyladenine glycosylase II